MTEHRDADLDALISEAAQYDYWSWEVQALAKRLRSLAVAARDERDSFRTTLDEYGHRLNTLLSEQIRVRTERDRAVDALRELVTICEQEPTTRLTLAYLRDKIMREGKRALAQTTTAAAAQPTGEHEAAMHEQYGTPRWQDYCDRCKWTADRCKCPKGFRQRRERV